MGHGGRGRWRGAPPGPIENILKHCIQIYKKIEKKWVEGGYDPEDFRPEQALEVELGALDIEMLKY